MTREKNVATIIAFYDAFAKHDAESMVRHYDNDVVFSDPAFGTLHGEQAKNMWRMLVRPGVLVTYANVQADETTGRADWVATYAFGPEKRNVVNRIHAEFVFRDGKIIRHTDKFDFHKWASQALGLKGKILGWTPFLHNQVRKTVLARLNNFVVK